MLYFEAKASWSVVFVPGNSTLVQTLTIFKHCLKTILYKLPSVRYNYDSSVLKFWLLLLFIVNVHVILILRALCDKKDKLVVHNLIIKCLFATSYWFNQLGVLLVECACYMLLWLSLMIIFYNKCTPWIQPRIYFLIHHKPAQQVIQWKKSVKDLWLGFYGPEI